MEIPLYRLFVRTALAWISGSTLLLSGASAQDELRLATSYRLAPGIPLSQTYIDSDPCAKPSKTGFHVTVVVETLAAANDDEVLIRAARTVSEERMTSARRGCNRNLDKPFKTYVTAVIDGLPVTRAEFSLKPGPPGSSWPLLFLTSKKILNTPANTETELGSFLNEFFTELGPITDRGRSARRVDVGPAILMVEATERTQPELGRELGLLKGELYRKGQENWRGL